MKSKFNVSPSLCRNGTDKEMVLSLLQRKQTAKPAHASGLHLSQLPGRLILELRSWNDHGMSMIHTIPVLQKYNDLMNLFQVDTPRRLKFFGLLHQYTKNLLEKELDRNSDKGIA